MQLCWRRISGAALVAACAILASPAWGQGDRDLGLLERALKAEEGLTYQAECIAETHAPIQPGAALPTRIVYTETVNGPAGLRRLDYKEPPALTPITQLEDRRTIYQIDRAQGLALRSPADAGRMLPAIEAGRMALLRENYTVSMMGIEAVAGRDCSVLEIMPKPDRAGNPWRRLFIDRHTSLPLRTENANGAGMLTNTRTVRRISYGFQAPEGHFKLPDDVEVMPDPIERGVAVQDAGDLAREAGFGPIEPTYIPDGYVSAGASVMRANGARAVHIMYFDGLSTISLFEERVHNQGGNDVWGNGGPGAHELNWVNAGIRFSLIGDLMPQELVRMRDSMPR